MYNIFLCLKFSCSDVKQYDNEKYPSKIIKKLQTFFKIPLILKILLFVFVFVYYELYDIGLYKNFYYFLIFIYISIVIPFVFYHIREATQQNRKMKEQRTTTKNMRENLKMKQQITITKTIPQNRKMKEQAIITKDIQQDKQQNINQILTKNTSDNINQILTKDTSGGINMCNKATKDDVQIFFTQNRKTIDIIIIILAVIGIKSLF